MDEANLASLKTHALVICLWASPETIWELKTAALAKSGLLSLHRGGESFTDLGGLEALKGFCTRAMTARVKASASPPAGGSNRTRT